MQMQMQMQMQVQMQMQEECGKNADGQSTGARMFLTGTGDDEPDHTCTWRCLVLQAIQILCVETSNSDAVHANCIFKLKIRGLDLDGVGRSRSWPYRSCQFPIWHRCLARGGVTTAMYCRQGGLGALLRKEAGEEGQRGRGQRGRGASTSELPAGPAESNPGLPD
jgi:hypothetical protein